MENKQDIPKYLSLYNSIKNDITSGVIKPGEKLKSEPQLIKEFGVARMTVRNALSMLVNEGLIEKHHGKGSFVKNNTSKKKIDALLDMSDYYFLPYNLQGICKVAEKNGAVLTVSDSKNSNAEIIKLISDICERGSDGVIIQGSPVGTPDKTLFLQAINSLKDKNIPYIIIDYIYNIEGLNYAAMDDIEIGRLAGIHLKDNGHKKVTAILFENNGLANQRYNGINKIISDIEIIYSNSITSDKLLSEIKKGTTAFFCFNDTVAQRCIDLLKDVSLSVPDDISVISVDDTIIADAYKITSVAHAKNKVIEYAANTIISGKVRTKIFTPVITDRNSVKQIN